MGRIKAGLVSGVWVLLLLVAVFGVVLNVPVVRASGTIYIRADGSIDPPTAPITSVDNVTYTLTGNITSDVDGIVVERSNITIDGDGYTLQGPWDVYPSNGFFLSGISNVIIIGTNINGFSQGVYLSSGGSHTISRNNITSYYAGVYLSSSNNNTISESSITNSSLNWGIEFESSSYNIVSGNNIGNNGGTGVYLYGSSNNTLSGNDISNNGGGISGGYSSNNTFISNVITNNTGSGISFSGSSNNTFYGNDILNNEGGLELIGSGNVLRNNRMVGNRYNFGADGTIQDIDSSNTVDGKPIYCWVNRSNMEIPSDAGYVALINSINITVNGLELKNNFQGLLLYNTVNAHITNNNISSNDVGLEFNSSPNNTITGNTITDNGYYGGIYFYSSSYNTLHENNVTHNVYYGIMFSSSSYNTLSGNTIENNGGVGVYFQESSFNNFHGNNVANNGYYGVILGFSSNYNDISANMILNNTDGVFLYGTYGLHSNTISENVLIENTCGIHTAYSDANEIYHNNFINNAVQVDLWGSVDSWDDGYPSGGNYWSDYTGVDADGDRIGDTPRVMDANNVDRYPLMSPWPSGPGLHELEVTLTAPTRLPSGNSTLLEATVRNNGFSNETSVSLFLFVNNTIVNSTTISSLGIGSSHTIDYFWTAVNEGYANVTTYATPVSEEIYVANNQKTKIVLLSSKLPVQNVNTGLYYETIQEAIDAPETIDGHTIEANIGIYYEHLTISKSLKIVGKDKNITTIDGNKTGSFVVQITANNVVLSGFTIRNSNTAPTPAIRIDSSNNVISNNTIINNGWGIYAFSVSNNTIENNLITNNVYGINLEWVTTHTVRNNTITNNQEAGIYLRESRNNVFTDNIVKNDKDGIVLTSDSNYNKLYHNNFIDNTSQGFTVNSDTNTWDNGYPSGGNYWSNYAGVDVKGGPNQDQSGSDGIGDTPHTFSGPNQDNYPLMNPMGSPQPPIAVFTYAPEHPLKDKAVTFNATSSHDRDGHVASYKWNFGDDNITTTTDPIITHIYTAIGTYQVNLTVTDNDGLSHSTIKSATVMVDSTPPTTLDDYDGLWHTTDFTITLTATDNVSGVAETCYKINDGPSKTVSADGHPLITTEGANNTLEYWSVDKAGNEELPHKILTGIKLDKTYPTIETPSRIPDGDVLPNQLVKVSVNVRDALSQVKNVTLYYTTNDGETWTDLPMNHTALNLYEATIPQQEAGTTVRFKMVAYDNAGNNAAFDGTEPYCTYQVIPEFSAGMILALFIVMTLVAVMFARKRKMSQTTWFEAEN